MKWAALALLLAGCVTLPEPARMDVAPVAFPSPGIYTGAIKSGSLTYMIGADGRGRSCFRNQFSGRMFFGDVIYTGAHLHTEDGAFHVEAVTHEAIQLRAPHIKADLRRVAEAPTVCREFFERK